MLLHQLGVDLVVCRLPPDAPVPAWALGASFFAITRTDRELSLVVPAESVPAGRLRPAELRVEAGWRAFRVAGSLAFDLVGVVASLARPLAEAGIPIFVISTFDTDYVLVKSVDVERAGRALRAAGHEIAEVG